MAQSQQPEQMGAGLLVFFIFIFFSYINDPECLYLRRRVKWLLPLLRVGREPGPLLGIYVKPQSFSPHLTACLRAPERQRNVKSFSRAQGSSLSSASLASTHSGGLDEDCCPLKARAGTFFFFYIKHKIPRCQPALGFTSII